MVLEMAGLLVFVLDAALHLSDLVDEPSLWNYWEMEEWDLIAY